MRCAFAELLSSLQIKRKLRDPGKQIGKTSDKPEEMRPISARLSTLMELFFSKEELTDINNLSRNQQVGKHWDKSLTKSIAWKNHIVEFV